ncbi:MAG: hypothetical protein K0Q56_1124 [Sporolactobacillus laevolacticus]|nr:hypothetical protein [Sporolactobacillus laevolacticus]
MNKAVKIVAVSLLFFSLAIGSILAPFGDSAQAASAFTARITVSKAKVHTGPGNKYRTIGTLYRNSSVTIKGKTGSWYKVSYKGKTRYIYGKYAAKIVRAKFSSYKAYVKSYSLKIRNKASNKYKTIRTVYMNTKVTVIGAKGSYSYIYSGGKKGYVQKKWLKSKIKTEQAYVNADVLSIKKGPGNGYQQVGELHRHDQVKIKGYSSGFYNVTYNGGKGYAPAQAIAKGTPPQASVTPPPAPVVQLNYSPVNAYTAYVSYDNLKIYQDPNSGSGVVATLREKTAVSIIGQNGDWMRIRFNNGAEGFVYKDNLTTDLNRFNPPAGAYGIDISHWQNDSSGGNLDFNAIKNSGISFVIVKATDGNNWSDNTFSTNAHNAQNAGLKVDAYHFFRAANTDAAKAEADNFANVLSNAGFNNNNLGYLFVDVETTNGIQGDQTTIRNTLSSNVNAFLNQMRARGFNKLGIYSGLSFYKNYIDMGQIDQPQRMLIWIARYRGQETNSGVDAGFNVDIWQYSSNGSVNGVNGAVDMDVSYYDPNAM